MTDKKNKKGKGGKSGLALHDPKGNEFSPSERVGEVWLCIDAENIGEVDSTFSDDSKTTASDVGTLVVWEDGEVKEIRTEVRIFGAALQWHVIAETGTGNWVAGRVDEKKARMNAATILVPLDSDEWKMVEAWIVDHCKVNGEDNTIRVKKSALEEPF